MEDLNKTLENLETKLVIIIGSGFHKQFLPDIDPKFNKLKDWKCLIDFLKVGQFSYKSSNNFLIDFEQLINQKNDLEIKQVSKIELDKSIELSKEIIKLSNEILENYNSEILKILDANRISDVINLNFDTIIEEKYASQLNIKFTKKTKSDYKKEGELYGSIFSKSNFRFREINGIKFWHPHGDVYHPKSLILSTRKYGTQLASIEKLRKHFKKIEKKIGYNNYKEFSWFEAILNKPLLILGAGLSSNEQDILFAISSKKRNFLNYPEKDYPIFQMLQSGEVSNIGDWAIPIMNEGDYKAQWKQLIKLFSLYEN